jgi:hypothetical protein
MRSDDLFLKLNFAESIPFGWSTLVSPTHLLLSSDCVPGGIYMRRTNRFLICLLYVGLVGAGFVSIAEALYPDSSGSDTNLPLYGIGYKFEGAQIVGNGVFADQSVPSFESLIKNRNKFSNYTEFVSYLFNEAPTLRNQFVLLHQSASLQIASKTHPRVIVFGGGKVFTFSEHPENKQLSVEMMEIDEGSRAVNLREIKFGKDGVIFDRSPQSCTACHGSPAKPVWDPYDFWPNAFGSISGGAAGRDEIRAYNAIRETSHQSPILSVLNLPEQPNLVDEQINTFTYILGQTHFYNWWKRKLAKFPPRSNLNGYRYALLSALNLCQHQSGREGFEHERNSIFELFSTSPLTHNEKDQLDLIFATIISDRRTFKDFLESTYGLLFPNHDVDFTFFRSRLELQNESQTHAFAYWILDMMGVDTSDLSTSLFKNNYLVSMPTSFPLDLLTVLYDVRPDLFFDLTVESRDLYTGQNSWLKLDCDQLKELARGQDVVKTESQWLAPFQVRMSQPVINRCAKCHVEGVNPLAPRIPFNDSRLMAQRLRSTDLGQAIMWRVQAIGKDQMPPEHPLTDEEKYALRSYLERLRYEPK